MKTDLIILLFVVLGILLQIFSSLSLSQNDSEYSIIQWLGISLILLNIVVIFIAPHPIIPLVIFTMGLMNVLFWSNLKNESLQSVVWSLDTIIQIILFITTAYYNVNFENIL